MSRTSYLVKNISLLTLSQFGIKFLSFFLLPLYTNILTTNEYGTFDLLSTTVSLFIPILTLGISSGILRYAMEKNTDKKAVFSYGFKFFFISSFIIFLLLLINYIFSFNTIIKQNSLFMFLLFVSMNLNGIISNFTRGLEKISLIAIGGIVCTLFTALLNIYFLLFLKLGLKGYLLANILGSFSQILFLSLTTKIWKYFTLKKIDINLKKDILSYSKPLVANDISWWVNNVSDRYIVTWFCGVGENGIYSVGYKIPSVLSMIQGIFAQAWTLSAIKDYDSEDSVNYFSKMYSLYNFAMVLICSGLIICTRFFASFLFAKEFFEAWKYVPFLLISVIFCALAGYVGAIFGAVKDTKIFAYSSISGAIINIILNIILVWKIGVIGAAISTLISSYVIWIMRMIRVKKYVQMKIKFVRDYGCYCLLIVQSLLLLFLNDSIILYSIEFLLFGIIILINFDVLKIFFINGLKGVKKIYNSKMEKK